MKEHKLENLKQLKELLNNLDDSKPIEFKTLDCKTLLFYAINYGGVINNDKGQSYTINQGIILEG